MTSTLRLVQRHFNTELNIFRATTTTNAIGEQVEVFSQVGQSFKGYLFVRGQRLDQFMQNAVEYEQTSHGLRILAGPDIRDGDKLTNAKGDAFRVVKSREVSGIGGNLDHLFITLDIVRSGNIQI